ncbi:hypothetical protein F5Y15DRAFT_396784 [Xylariaceae sp. FL0016]|nr:hypothetical protein F5Y15DRAFT_396784 [Xylariaceae sp. FL0016]
MGLHGQIVGIPLDSALLSRSILSLHCLPTHRRRLASQRRLGTVHLLGDSAEDGFDHVVCREASRPAVPRHGVDDVARSGLAPQMVVDALEGRPHLLVVADLEQHNAQLVCWGVQRVELFGRVREHGGVIVVRHAGRDDQDVDSGEFRVGAELLEVPAQNLAQPRAQLALALGLDVGKDLLHTLGLALIAAAHLANVVVPALTHRREAWEVEERSVVDEVQVDAVVVVLEADGRHGLHEVSHVRPLPFHVLRIVDQEERLKVLQERERLGRLVAGRQQDACIWLTHFRR